MPADRAYAERLSRLPNISLTDDEAVPHNSQIMTAATVEGIVRQYTLSQR